MRGSPIRTSSDQRSVGSSPRLNAASHVLHRLLVPRHPPCALNNLTTRPTKTRTPPRTHTPTARTIHGAEPKDARVHSAVLNLRPDTHPNPPPDPPPHTGTTAVREQAGPDTRNTDHTPTPGGRPVPSGPNSAPTTTPAPPDSGPRHPRKGRQYWEPAAREPAELVSVPPSSTVTNTRGHPTPGNHHGPRTALDHQTRSGGQCSLERR